jgi:hypothetical protein
VIETRVFDHTAITALFRGNDAAFRLWQDADNDQVTLIPPAVAVAEANTLMVATATPGAPSSILAA